MPVGSNAPSAQCDQIIANAAAQAMGKFGKQFLAGVNAEWTGQGTTTAPYGSGILIVTDTVFNTLTGIPAISTTGTVTALTAITFPAGLYIPGLFSYVKLTSGAVLIDFA